MQTESSSAGKYKFFLDTIYLWVNHENIVAISQIKNELSNRNITLSSNATPISYKIDTDAQGNVILVKRLESNSPKPDFWPINVKLSSYNGSKIPGVGNSLLTLAHKNNIF